MAMFTRNVVKSVSNFSNNPSLYILKRHHIFKSAAAEHKYRRLLVRRFGCSGIDESQHFSNSSSPITDILYRVYEGFSFENRYFCGTTTPCYSALSPQNFSPSKNSNFPSFQSFSVVGSCLGLVCLENPYRGNLIWNPSTNEVKSLPPSKLCPPFPHQYSSSETLIQPSGLGYDSASNDYKLVRWVNTDYEDEEGVYIYTTTHTELYSLRSDSWKMMLPSPAGGVASHGISAYVNGHYYWPNRSGRGIVSFDFAAEEFSHFPLPLPHTIDVDVDVESDLFEFESPNTLDLFEFRGSLGVVIYEMRRRWEKENEKTHENKLFEVWVWNEGSRSWTKEFDDCLCGADRPLGFWENGRLLFFAGGSTMARHLLVYDIATKELKKLDVYCHPTQFELFSYVENMLPLNGTSP